MPAMIMRYFSNFIGYPLRAQLPEIHQLEEVLRFDTKSDLLDLVQ